MLKIQQDLQKLANPQKAAILQGFFKTGKGEYGEGDVFLGITVPQQREIAKKHVNVPFIEISYLLKSKVHEHRLTALLILIYQYQKADEDTKKKIVDFYLKQTQYINNWDLVDLSAHKILGDYLFDQDKKIVYTLAISKNMWERRIAVIATFAFIKQKKYDDTLKLCTSLLNDNHDVIHKACGWMLREIGKRDQKVLENYLDKHAHEMPRTMLRYSIERLDETKRKKYLKKS